jgi:hypothetical protein
MHRPTFVSAALLAPAAVVISAAPAHAYLDPGTGSILLQGILGGIAGAAVVLRLYWARLKSFFRGGSGKKDAPDGAA